MRVQIKVNVRGNMGDGLHLSPYATYVVQEKGNPVSDGTALK